MSGGGNLIDEGGKVLAAADLLQLALAAQFGSHGHDVNGLGAVVHLEHRAEDDAVGVAVEVLFLDDAHRPSGRAGLDEHCAQARLFRLQILRRQAVGRHVRIPG